MKKFNYRLRGIEDFRKERLKTALRELKKVRDAFKSEKEFLDILTDQREDYREKLKDKSHAFLELNELNWYKEYLHLLEEKIEEKKQNLRKLRQNLIQLKKLTQKREKEKKTLEKNRQAKFTQFLNELRKEEQKEMDEVSRVISHK
ncbi:MAG: flagellar export protein FliJ [candidate division Zixibacteria bacterium]|nr:flagellar export protein FliJ [candidate division Zixibacteria bacterium]